MKRTAVLAAVISLCLAAGAVADVPRTINYQGRLTDADGAPVVDGNYSIRVTLYDAANGGTQIWSDVFDAVTKSGYFNIVLGSGAQTMANVKFDIPYWVGIKVGLDNEMTPRQPLSSAPYAMNVARGAVTDTWTSNLDTLTINNNNERTIVSIPIILKTDADLLLTAKSTVVRVEGTGVRRVRYRLYIDSTLYDSTVIGTTLNTETYFIGDIALAKNIAAGAHTVELRVLMDVGTELPIDINSNRLIVIACYK